MFLIDGITREITSDAPKEDVIFGVTSDEKSNIKYFKGPRYTQNGVDLAASSLRINYINGGAETDQYIVNDLDADEEYITFSWEFRRNVTKYKGTVYFIVCAVICDADGSITNEWNTIPAKGTVFQGIEVDGSQYEEETADAIESILLVAQSRINAMVVDATLSQEGVAADAAAVGKVVSELKDTTNQLSEEIAELEESGFGGSGGQPIVVKKASYITDTTAIYLYMGDGETVNNVEYVYGYVYTYDTDTASWVNSGLYGKGKDGYTPTVTAEQTDTGVSITVTDKDGSKTVEVENGTATDEQVEIYVNAWLDEHPEATTTVEDGSLETEKYKDASVTLEKTSFFVSEAEEVEDLIGGFSVAQNWGTLPSKKMYVEDVNFLTVVAENGGSIYMSCAMYTLEEDGTYTKSDTAVTKISLYDNAYREPKGMINVFVLGGYTGYVAFDYSQGISHIYKNSLPPLEKPTMLDDDLYKQGLEAHYIEKPYWYVGANNAGDIKYPKLVYKAESTEEKVKCYHNKKADRSTANVSIYDENWNLVETITGTKVYDLTVSGGIYYVYVPEDNSTATEEERNFLGNEEMYNLWVQHGKQYSWVYLLTDKQVSQVIESQELEDFVEDNRNSHNLEPKFTYVGELWDTNIGKYQAWSFNNLKWDSVKGCMVMMLHDANSHSDGNTTQCYLKEINPHTFECKNLPRIQVNGANIASYGFEILNNGTYITLASYNGGMRLLMSIDGGNTWTAGEVIQEFTDNGMYSGKYHPFALQKLSNGRLFVVMDTSQNEMFYSDNNGETWLTATIPMGDITYTMTEPDLTELDDKGTVMMIARSSMSSSATADNLAHTIFSISTDYGATWETAQLSEVRANGSDATALVHDGIVEVFSCNKYCTSSLNMLTTLINNTGFYGDIRRYYATIEEAKQNIWHYAGIMGFAQTTNPAYDLGSPCCFITPDGDIWVGFYDQADDGTSGKMLYRWFVANKNGSYNFAKGIKELAEKIAELSAN